MDTIFLLVVACVSSLLVWLAGRRWLRFRSTALAAALGSAAETVGAALLFWFANVGLCAALALFVRGLRLGFVSLYLSGDVTLAAVALLQALVFESWRRHSIASSK